MRSHCGLVSLVSSGVISRSAARLVLSDNSARGVSPVVRSEFEEVVMAGIEAIGTAGGAGVLEFVSS